VEEVVVAEDQDTVDHHPEVEEIAHHMEVEELAPLQEAWEDSTGKIVLLVAVVLVVLEVVVAVAAVGIMTINVWIEDHPEIVQGEVTVLAMVIVTDRLEEDRFQIVETVDHHQEIIVGMTDHVGEIDLIAETVSVMNVEVLEVQGDFDVFQ